MLKKVLVLATAAAVAAPAAFAGECNAKEAELAGKTAADLTRAHVEKVMAVEGKEMMNLSACKTRGANFEVKYKYNFMGADGYNWVEGEGVVSANGGTVDLKRVSDKLKDAAAAKNVTLAAR